MTGEKIGYARVSTREQNLDLQIDALKKAGCNRIFTDTASGVQKNRQGLEELKKYIRSGDCLVVWKFDRLARSMRDLVEWLDFLRQREVSFESLNEKIDTSSPFGEAMFQIIAALAQFERQNILARSRAGLEAARARGRVGGARKKLNERQVERLLKAYKEKRPIQELVTDFKIGKTALYRYINNAKTISE